MPTQSPITIRRATIDDAPAMHAIIHAAYRTEHENAWTSEAHLVEGERISLAELRAILIDHADSEPFLVAEQGDAEGAANGSTHIVGCIQIQTHGCADDEAMFGLFSVSPALQGHGVGGKLVRAALTLMKQDLGKRQAKLWVLNARTELIAWYEKLGFRHTEEKVTFAKPELAKQDIHFVVYAMAL